MTQMPNLQNPILNFGYQYAYERLLAPPRTLLDVGCRTSGWPAWISTQGYDVVGCELDPKFLSHQLDWQRALSTSAYETRACDVRTIVDRRFDITTAFCAIPHSAEEDVACYEHVARITNHQIILMNEFHPTEGSIHRGRDDGDMRIYSPKDMRERVLEPIVKTWRQVEPNRAVGLVSYMYLAFDHPAQTIQKVDNPAHANMILTELRRPV